MSDLFGHNTGTAVISDCGRYRYQLTRGQAPFVSWLMLNPSTADAQVDDPTIRRCTKFAQSWGYGGIIVVNIYPFRSSSPAECRRWAKNIGADDVEVLDKNLDSVNKAARISALNMVAFGSNIWNRMRVAYTIDFYDKNTHGPLSLCCLGTNKDGWPLHPMARGKLRVPDDQKPVPWAWPEVVSP